MASLGVLQPILPGLMLTDDDDHAHSPLPHGSISSLSVEIWSRICDKLMRYPVQEYELQYSGFWDHIGNPRFGPQDLAGPHGSHVNLYKIYNYVRRSVKLAQTRRVKPRRPVRMLDHGRTLPEISGSFLRHQRPSEAVELPTTCGAQCERIHKYLKKNGKTLSNADGLEAGDDNESSDAWRYWEYTWDHTSNDDTSDEDTSSQDTSGEDMSDQDTNDGYTNDEDHDVDDDDYAESSEENNDGYESLEL